MIQFLYNKKEYSLQDDWKELTFGQYYKIIELIDTSKALVMPEILQSLELISILTDSKDELDDIPYTLHIELAPYVEKLIRDVENFNIKNNLKIEKDYFILNGVNYSFNKGEFQAAEIADIADYARQYSDKNSKDFNNDYKLILKVAAVIIRPAVEMETEIGSKYWKLVKRNYKDQDIQEYNIRKMNALWVCSVVNFFFSGKKDLKKDIKNYIIKK